MNGMRIMAALFATICLLLGFMVGRRLEYEFANTMFIAGAIVICGILISSAIMELNKGRS